MATNLETPPLLLSATARRRSWFFKLASIGLLLALLHIPLLMTHGVLRERQNYQTQATAEISGVWGREQRVFGPVLAVPYAYKGVVSRAKVVDGRAVTIDETVLLNATAYFLPEELKIDGNVDPEIRHRGIYDAVVYAARVRLAGSFQPNFTAAGIDADVIDWQKARVLFGVSDLHGLRAIAPVAANGGRDAAFESIDAGDALLPLAAKVGAGTAITRLEFDFETTFQGSGSLTLAPIGKKTEVNLRSAWPDPSFVGAWLPVARQVTADGFKAEWQSAHFSRGFPQSWTTRFTNNAELTKKIDAAAFGVRFARSVDSYSVVERAQKYGVLFFVLVFAVFFLFEVTAELRIHPLQYAMVGAALCLFFLGFLALTEFWETGLAYGVAAGACTGLVSLYSWSFLRTGRRTLVITGGLGATYAYLYFVLKSQDYALIAGTIALFAALALAMFCTRRINWYSLEVNSSAPAK